jgi:hypothetical protein
MSPLLHSPSGWIVGWQNRVNVGAQLPCRDGWNSSPVMEITGTDEVPGQAKQGGAGLGVNLIGAEEKFVERRAQRGVTFGYSSGSPAASHQPPALCWRGIVHALPLQCQPAPPQESLAIHGVWEKSAARV